MNLMDYIRILTRRGWIVALAVVITAGAAYGFSKTQTEVYRASQKVLLLPSRSDLGLTETMRILLRSFVEYLDTDTVAQVVITNLELDLQPGDLRADSAINSDPTTLTIQIDVDLEDQEAAARIATEWGRQLVEWRGTLNAALPREERIEAQLLDTASVGLYRPQTKINVLAGAILGLIIGGAIVFVLEYLESNIMRRPEDIERVLEVPLLATIPQTD
jgi:capsular polysaccharide biosynthesis protein